MILMTQRNYHLAGFLFILFFPLLTSFLLPSLFYNVPIKFRTHNVATDTVAIIELGAIDILRTSVVWITWIVLAVLPPILLSRTAKTKVRDWSVNALQRGFFIISIIGCIIALTDNVFSFGNGLEQIFKQLSISPVVATILGIKVLQERHLIATHKKSIIVVSLGLLVLNVGIAVVIPILLGKAAPAIYASIAIMYGLFVLKVGWKQQIALWVVFAIFCVFALAYKENFRTSWMGNMFWQNGKSVRIPVKDVFSFGLKQAYLNQVVGNKQLVLDTPLNLSHDKWRSFSYYDPNYYNIRFISDADEHESLRFVLAKSLHRISHLGDLANAMRLTPSVIPYLAGATYYPLLFKPIPRFLWKDKPEENSGQLYGHQYNILHPTDHTTSANLNVVTEAWINGGWPVVVLSAFSFGLLIHFFWAYLIGEASGTGNVVLGMVFIISGAATESSMNLVAGGIIYGVITWWFIDYVVRVMDKRNEFP